MRHNGTFKRGPENPRWNEGQILHVKGYRMLRVGFDHPLSNSKGYAFEHLTVWCASGRAKPSDGYMLHHKNGVKTDNRLENLELMEWRHHTEEHNAQARAIMSGYGPPERNDDKPF